MISKKIVIGIVFILCAIVASMYFFGKKEKFTGDFSVDSGFYAVDSAMGGSGILSDPINQSRME